MAVFTISDLHLSFSSDKPMDIFTGWNDYIARIGKNWKKIINADDTVVLPGDLSWALKLEDTKEDFAFINSLPGRKLILKGNHDLWWSTLKKMRGFFSENGFDTLDFVHNSAVPINNICICGTRGWFYDDTGSNSKVLLREAGRLETSILHAQKTGLEAVVFLHYPPVYGGQVCDEIFDIILKYNIKRVYYGHIHGSGALKSVVGNYKGVRLKLVACDQVGFTPVLVSK